MFLNILRISASNVLKMFLNIIVSIGCSFVIFHSHKSTGSKSPLFLASTCLPRKEYKINKKKKDKVVHAQHYRQCCTDENFTKLQVISMILCSIQNKSSSPFLSLGYVLSMFLNLRHFLKKKVIKMSVCFFLNAYLKSPQQCTRKSTPFEQILQSMTITTEFNRS